MSPRRSHRRGSWTARLSPSPHGSSGRPRPGRRRPSRSRSSVPSLCPAGRRPSRLSVCSSAASGRFGSAAPSEASNASRSARRDRMPGPVADLEEPLAGRAAAAGEPVAAVLARERDSVAARASQSRTAPRSSTPRREPGRPSRASSSRRRRHGAPASRRHASAAWIPPCAFAELHDWRAPFVANPTRAP